MPAVTITDRQTEPPKTVRAVLREHLGRFVVDDEEMTRHLDLILGDLREVLTTGEVWRTREVVAAHLEPGDVLVAKDGLLWSVTAVPETDDGKLSPELVRGAEVKTPVFGRKKPVRILLAASDVRALAVLETQLGAETVSRSVA